MIYRVDRARGARPYRTFRFRHSGFVSWLLKQGSNHRRMKIQMANGQILRPEAVGSCRVKLLTETGSVREVVLHGVVYHREFSENLLSIRRLAVDSGFKGSFGPDELDNYLMHKKSGDIIRQRRSRTL